MKSRHFLVCLGALVVAVGLLGARLAGASAAQDASTSDKVIELPKYTVSDTPILPPQESWKYAKIPGFEVLSNANTSRTKAFMEDFQLLRQVVNVVWPAVERLGPSGPMMVILCGRGNSFNQFLPKGERLESDRYNSIFNEDAESTVIVVDFAAADLYVTGSGPVSVNSETGEFNNGGREESDPFRAFRVQYFRNLARRSVRNAPAWFEEGLAQLCASVDYTKTWIEFGKVGDGFGGSKVGDFNQIMAQRGIMGLAKLFAGDRSNLDHDERYVWSAQCYAFVHMCLYGLNGKYLKPFAEFLDRSTKEPVSEALFKQCFKRSYNDMEIEIRGYIEFTVHKYQQWEAKKGKAFATPEKVVLRDATDSEIGRIKGEALRLAGNKDEARTALIAPYIRGERDAALLASLGLYELEQNDPVRARKFLEAAIKAGSVRSRANLELAKMRYYEVNAAAKEGRLSAQQVAQVLQPLYALRNQNNRLPEVYELAAQTLLAADGLAKEEVFKFIMEGAMRFPARIKLIYLAAALSIRTQHWQEARALVDHGLKYSTEAASREEFVNLGKQIPGDVKSQASEPEKKVKNGGTAAEPKPKR